MSEAVRELLVTTTTTVRRELVLDYDAVRADLAAEVAAGRGGDLDPDHQVDVWAHAERLGPDHPLVLGGRWPTSETTSDTSVGWHLDPAAMDAYVRIASLHQRASVR